MPKQLNQLSVGLAFTADTSQAKKQIQDLQQSLSRLITQSSIGGGDLGLKKEISESIQLAAQLKVQLDHAVDMNNGKLNLVKFNQQLTNSGTKLSEYRDALMRLGPEGASAFASLSTAIIRADAPIVSLNKHVKELGVTLANSVRWQLSSSAIHAFMGAIQGAYGYAQDLNKSLNDIAIVTGQSRDQMAAFAEQANKSAQALSTSTLAYTDAALIFYQQGLTGKDVTDRTDVVMKLSNVTGQSAEEVSSWMTAIWNNFADGTVTLESFADKITALGASTASSSEEIAQGLQQFAALGSTLGLNYDDAVAALATVVAQTRQSASTVGNSFRTIIQRIESVKLGDTLEDGVDLTKYSAALDQIGVQILDEEGELRNMSLVFQEMGEKWGTLTKAQKDAVAQTVGGVRNANTLMAWFNNFDKYQENLETVYNADGALQKQQDIYEDSWLAASRRVKAAWESIYSDLIDDKFFIDLNKGLASIIESLDRFIDKIGGLKGLLITLAPLATSIFKDNMAKSIDNASTALLQLTPTGQEIVENRRKEASQALSGMYAGESTIQGFAANKALQTQSDVQYKYLDAAKQMNEYQQQIAQHYLDQHNALVQNVLATKQELDSLERIVNIEERRQDRKINKLGPDLDEEFVRASYEDDNESADKVIGQRKEEVRKATNGQYESSEAARADLTALRTEAKELDNLISLWDNYLNVKGSGENGSFTTEQIESLQRNFEAIQEVIKETDGSFEAAFGPENAALMDELADALGYTKEEADGLYQKTKEFNPERYQQIITQLDANMADSEGNIEALTDKLLKAGIITEDYVEKMQQTSGAHQTLSAQLMQATLNADDFGNKLAGITTNVSAFAESVSLTVRSLSQIASVVNSAARLGEIWSDDNLSFAQKLTKSLSILAVMLPTVTALTNSLTLAVNKHRAAQIINIALQQAEAAGKKKLTEEEIKALALQHGISVGLLQEAAGHAAAQAGATLHAVALGILQKAMIALKAVSWELWLMLAAIAAVIAIVVVGFKNMDSFSPEGRIKKLNEELEKSKEIAEQTSAAYSQATGNLERYIELKERLAKLNAGEKVEEIQGYNEDIRDQLYGKEDEDGNQIYSGLSASELAEFGKIEYDESGLIKLTDTQQEILDNHYRIEDSQARQVTYAKELELIEERRKQTLTNFEWGNNPNLYESETSADTLNEAVADALYDKGIYNLDKGNLSNIMDVLKEANVENTDYILEQFQDWSDEDFSKFNEFLAEYFREKSEAEVLQAASARDQMESSQYGNDFSENYNASQQEYITGKIQEYNANNENGFSQLAEDAKTLDELLKAIGVDAQELDKLKSAVEEVDNAVKVNVEDFTQLKGSVKNEDLEAEMNQLSDYLDRNIEKIEDLDNSLKGCDEALDKIAYSMMRFDDALQDVQSNYDKWSKALNSDDIYSQQMAVEELTKTYGNLLDIDGSQLSDDFLSSTENLELMNQVLNGTEEEAVAAYNKLADLSAMDYLETQIGVKLNEQEALDALNYLNELKDTYNYDDIKIGASIDDTGFIQGLEALINATASTAEEAEAMLARMGFDADVEQQEIPEEEAKDMIDLMPSVVPNAAHLKIPTLAQDGTLDYEELDAPGLKYNPEHNTEPGESKKTFTALKIKPNSLRKSASGGGGGNIKVHNSPARTGTTGKPSKGGGGGGGGGGSKKKTTKDPAKKKFEEDRYHNIKSALDEVAKALERVDKLKERAYGKAKLKYMDQEIAKLKDQARLQNAYIKEAETYLKMDRSKLQGLGMGAEFTDDGRLINYEQVLSNLVDKYNDAVDARNAAAEAFNNSAQEEGDTEAFDAAEKRLKKAEETYNEQKKILDQYEKTYNTLQEQIDKRTEILNKIYDAKLAKVVYKVDIQLEFNDADIKYLEWLNKFLEKNLDNAEDIMANLSKAAQRTFKDIEAINQGLVELFANHEIKLDFNNMNPDVLVKQLQDFMDKEGLGSEITEAEAKQIRDWNDKLMDYMSKWVEYWDKTHEMIDKVFEDYTKNVDREIDKMDAYTKLLDHYLKMLDLSGGADRLGFSAEDILNVYDTRIQNEQNILSSLVTERKALEQTLLDYQKNLSEAETEEAKQYWENHIKNAEDALQDVKDKVISATESTLEAVNERIEKAMELAEKQFKKRFDNLDLLMERFDRQQELDHLYLDDYEKYYELNKSAKELQKAIEGTNNAMMRGRFKDLQDEINASMSSGVKLSQLQTDIIAKRVELLKAEDELLNARNAKNTVRMTRDNEGNYSYTYTADQDMIDDAELNYNEKFYQLMNAERSGQEDLQGQRLEYLNNYTSISQDLMNQLQSGAISQDQYDQAMTELQDQFQEYMDYYLEQLNFLYDQQAVLRDDDLVNAQELTELKLANYDDFITLYEETILGRLFDDVTSEEEFTRLALEAMAQYHMDNAEALSVWETEVSTTYEAAGLDVDTFRDTVNTDLAEIDEKSQETKEKITEMTTKMREDMQAVMEKALAMDRDWAVRMKSMQEQISNTVKALNAMLEKLSDVSGAFGYSGDAAKYAEGRYREAAAGAEEAADAFEHMANEAREAEKAAKAALDAVKAYKNAGDVPADTTTPVGGGCFDPGTKITMFDGSLKNIEEIKVGDIVLSYDELTKEYLPQKVNDVMVHHNTIQLLDVYFSNDLHLGLTACHPILTTSGWKSLNYEVALLEHWIETAPLEVGQQVISISNSDIFITDIIWRKDIENYDTYNISVENIHTYIANGIVVHNAHDKISAFATGGYTGSWGSEGHLAMLHEKEIVLNESDTSNMLNIVGMTRDLIKNFDPVTGLNNLVGSIANSSALALNGMQDLNQNVHIEASFPNVQSHSEIELAFENLINSTTQYIHRK